MRYALLVSHDENAKISAAEQSRRAVGLASVAATLAARGLLVSGQRLQSAGTGATVRCWGGGDVVVSREPVVAANEQLAAFFVVDCTDEDAAIDIATHIPAAWYGSVEVRLVLEDQEPDLIKHREADPIHRLAAGQRCAPARAQACS